MRSGSIALRAAGGAAALVLTAGGSAGAAAGAPYADDHAVKVSISPATTTPGTEVEVRVQGCAGDTGNVRSDAFVADVELSARDGRGKPLFGDTSVKSGIAVGAYKVGVQCDGREHRDIGAIQIVRSLPPSPKPPPPPKPKPKPSPSPSRSHSVRPTQAPKPDPTLTPVAPVRAGGGGTATHAAGSAGAPGAEGQGPGTRHAVIGLVLAGVTAVVVAFRSSRRRGASPGAD